VAPESDRVIPCHATEVVELPAGGPTPSGDAKQPVCSGGFFGPATCVALIGEAGESRKVAVVVQ
jgi:hypothetical protein